MVKKPKPKVSAEQRIIDSALDLACEHGWRHVTVNEIAEKSDMALSELLRILPTKSALLGVFVTHIDAIVLDQIETAASQESKRDQLFDILMARFDALQPYREGLAAVLRDSLYDPLSMARQFGNLRNSMIQILELADVSTSGPFGAIRIQGLTGVYALTFRVWLKDDTQDMSKTMATLDRSLAQVEKIARLIPR